MGGGGIFEEKMDTNNFGLGTKNMYQKIAYKHFLIQKSISLLVCLKYITLDLMHFDISRNSQKHF